jgi:hypothetical protein
MPLERNLFERAIELGNYIDAVEQTLKADDPDDPQEELRDKLFWQRLFESALRQAVSEVKYYDWLLDKQQQPAFPPEWWTKHDTLGEKTPKYYTDYRSRFIKVQLFCAFSVAQQQRPSIKNFKEDLMRFKADQFGFSVGFLYDCAQVFCTNALTSVDFIQSVKVPVLLVAGEKGGAAYLHLEQVTLGIDSEPYPHPIKMSMIPIDKTFNNSVINAFSYFKTRNKPKTFRWWLEPIEPPNLNGVQHGSLYGAFLAGMHSSVHHINWPANTVVTCGGDDQGQLFGIDGLAQKCEAAIQQGWNTVIVSNQNDQDGNALSQKRPELNIVEVDNAY